MANSKVMLTKLAAAVLIVAGAALFIPSIYGDIVLLCFYIAPPYGVQTVVTSAYTSALIEVSIRLTQLALVVGGVALYARASRAGNIS